MNTENLTPTMSDNDVEKLQQFMEDNKNNSEQLTEVFEAMNPQEDAPVEEGESRIVQVAIDPATGKEIVTNAEAKEDEEVSIDSLFNSDEFNFNIDESPITLEELKAYLETTKDDPILKGELTIDNITPDDLTTLLDLVIKYQNKEEIQSPYNKLPKVFQDVINKGVENNFSNSAKSFKNTMAEVLLDEFVSTITIDRANSSINSGVEKIFNAATKEIGDTIVGYTEERNESYRKYIEENITDPDKKEQALAVLDRINSAYDLTFLKEYCKRCKIKKFEVEEPSISKNNDMNYFLAKYNNNTNYNIYNIYNAQMVLARNINTGSEKFFNDKQIRAFMIAFCKFCQNYTPNNTLEHVFMFYVVYNIVLTDVNKGEKAEVSKKFLENVKECIRNLIVRNAHLGE